MAKEETAILRAAAEIRQRRAIRVPQPQQEPPRRKTHWDFLLEEMKWMADEFRREKRMKLRVCKNIAAKAARSKLDVHSRQEARSPLRCCAAEPHACRSWCCCRLERAVRALLPRVSTYGCRWSMRRPTWCEGSLLGCRFNRRRASAHVDAVHLFGVW